MVTSVQNHISYKQRTYELNNILLRNKNNLRLKVGVRYSLCGSITQIKHKADQMQSKIDYAWSSEARCYAAGTPWYKFECLFDGIQMPYLEANVLFNVDYAELVHLFVMIPHTLMSIPGLLTILENLLI